MDERTPNNEQQTAAGRKSKHMLGWIAAVVAAIIVVLGAIAYLHRPDMGTVSAISATSITIRPSGSATTDTFSITNTTQMGLPYSGGSSADDIRPQKFNARDIHVGQSVIVQAGPSSNQTQLVTVNPLQ